MKLQKNVIAAIIVTEPIIKSEISNVKLCHSGRTLVILNLKEIL